MTNKHIQRKWNEYFESEVDKGISKSQIRKDLAERGVSDEYIELKLRNYQKNKNAKRIMHMGIVAIIVAFIIFAPFIFNKPTITGAPVGVGGDIFYVDATNGNDNNNGLSPENAIKTIAKVNTLQLDPGDSVLFKRGEVWRCESDDYIVFPDGSISGNITYGAYGIGNKPLFLGSINASNASLWTNVGNLWTTRFNISEDVGNLIFNDEDSWGTKHNTSEVLDTQGDFYYNYSNYKLTMYSISNPGNYYSSIEITSVNGDVERNIFQLDNGAGNAHDLIIRDLEFKYGGNGAIGCNGVCNNIYIINNTVSWMGGVYQYIGRVRFGNGIGVGLNANNVKIMYNEVTQVYDACISPQAWGTNDIIQNVEMAYNVVSYCHYGFEYFNNGINGQTHNVRIHHNTIMHSSEEFSANQRDDTMIGSGLRLSRSPSTTYNFLVRDNIIYGHGQTNMRFSGGSTTNWGVGSEFNSDYNLYYDKGSYGLISWMNNYYQTLISFNLLNGNESHSRESDPLFVDPANGDFRPQAGSPACTMSSTGSYVGALPCAEESEPEPFCGDDDCNGDETCSSCEEDCGECVPSNSVPTHSTPLLTASDAPLNSTNATLNCYNVSTADADGDAVMNSYRWFKNNVVVSGLTSSSVGQSYTSVGESWKCEIRPYDGKGYGVARNSSSLAIRVLCNNSICESGETCSSCPADCGICTLSACTLEDSIWDEDTNLTNAYNLSSCFTDPLGQTLSYSVSGNSSIRVVIGRYGLVNLSAPADWKGFEYVSFTATAGNRSAQSNVVTLIVRSAPDCGDAICEGEETCSNCAGDCGICPVCGDGTCNGEETCSSCREDCDACPSSGGGGGGGTRPPSINVTESSNESGVLLNESTDVVANESEVINQTSTEIVGNASLESPTRLPTNNNVSYVGTSSEYAGGKLKDKNTTQSKSSSKTKSLAGDGENMTLVPTKESPRTITITGDLIVSKASFYMTLAAILLTLSAVLIFVTGKRITGNKIEAPTKLFTPYIISCLDNGYSFDAIRISLRSKDLSEEYIEKCFKELKAKGYATRVRVKVPVIVHLPAPVRKKLFEDLSAYVTKKVNEGFTLRDIRLALLSYGHSKDLVEEIFEGKEKKLAPPVQNFIPFITACLNSGYSYDAIRIALTSKNLSKGDIDRYFDDLKAKGYEPKIRVKEPVYMSLSKDQKTKLFNALSVYVTKQLHEGFELEDIKQVLVNYGHSKDIVEDVIESKK